MLIFELSHYIPHTNKHMEEEVCCDICTVIVIKGCVIMLSEA